MARAGFPCFPGSLDGYERQIQTRALEGGLGPKFVLTVGLSCHSRGHVGGLVSPGPHTGPDTQLVFWINLPVTNKSLCRTQARTGRSPLTSHLKLVAAAGGVPQSTRDSGGLGRQPESSAECPGQRVLTTLGDPRAGWDPGGGAGDKSQISKRQSPLKQNGLL